MRVSIGPHKPVSEFSLSPRYPSIYVCCFQLLFLLQTIRAVAHRILRLKGVIVVTVLAPLWDAMSHLNHVVLKNEIDPLTLALKYMPHPIWGYAIYRCTYESDADWATLLDVLGRETRRGL